jgi:hypothetical protein
MRRKKRRREEEEEKKKIQLCNTGQQNALFKSMF